MEKFIIKLDINTISFSIRANFSPII